jgi:outer membrane protein assembly factor BamB
MVRCARRGHGLDQRGRAAWWSIPVGAALVAAGLAASAVRAQTIDVERPRTLVVGTPTAGGGSRADRGDVQRSGRARTALPTGSLRTEWRDALGVPLEVSPVVDERGTTYVVSSRGEVVAVGRDGAERWRAQTGATQSGPPALTSDDSLVFVDGAGDAVAVRDGAVRWRARFGRADTMHPAPLPLEDGGTVVAMSRDLAALDADGHERGRATLPEPARLPLVAALGKVVAVTASGAVWTWTPGATEVTRVGSFGSPAEDGATLADERTLVAVTSGHLHLTALDLVRGTATTRAVAPAGLWLGPPAMRGETAYLVLLAPTSELVVAVDPAGVESARAVVGTRLPPVAADGGVAPLVALPNTPPLVDASGTFAFATPEGGVGVVSDGVVDLLPDACPAVAAASAHATAPVVALVPLGSGAFVVACRSGTLLALRGAAR